MKQAAIIVIALALFAGTIRGGDQNGNATATATGFTISAETRNPFWPIGWERKAAAPEAAPVVAPVIDASQFRVTSISLLPERVAVINGGVYGEGETIRFKAGTRVIPVRVVSVQDGSVVLAGDGNTITVKLIPR